MYFQLNTRAYFVSRTVLSTCNAMMNKTHTFPSERGHNLVVNKVMRTEHTHGDMKNAHITKVPIEQRQRSLHREDECLSSVKGGVSLDRKQNKTKPE